MNKKKIVASIGIVFILAGIYGMISSIMPDSSTKTVTIPAGDYYYEFQTVELMGGHISGDYEVTSSGSVMMYIFSESQYNSLVEDGVLLGYIDMSISSSATFSIDTPASGKTYLLFFHNTGWDSISQDVRVHMYITGIVIPFLIGGLIAIAVGAVLVVVAVRMKKKAASAAAPAPVPPQPTDVMMFEKKEP